MKSNVLSRTVPSSNYRDKLIGLAQCRKT